MSIWENIRNEYDRWADAARWAANDIEPLLVDETGKVVGGYGIGRPCETWREAPSSADSAEQGRAR